jgi:NAD(P)-dependent dehydrogenase (short-subunit alcohol dehydrogenase family)
MTSNHAVVVGGTRGLGRGLVELWSEGTDVISIIGRREPSTTLPLMREGIRHYSADITQPGSIIPALNEIVRVSGPISRLVFSQRYRGSGDTLDQELEVGLKGTQRIIDQLVERTQFADRAAIVVISSVCSHLIAAEQPLGYHVNKAGLEHLVRFYAVQLASKGIRVNAVAPNLIEKEEGREFYRQNPEIKQHYESVIPLGQMGTLRDVAYAIDFLCSERAAYITGQTLIVDGGLTLLLQHSLASRPPIKPT